VAAAPAGGIYGLGRVEIRVEGSLVVGNAAFGDNGGGGIYISTDSTLRVSNTTVEKNSAVIRGGEQTTHFWELLTHIMCWSPQSLTVLPWYDFCVDDCSGGICGVIRVEIIVEGSLVVGNVASGDTGGGGIYISTDSKLRVTNTTVEKNSVVTRGGEQHTFGNYSRTLCAGVLSPAMV
jgi:hypothetical protein